MCTMDDAATTTMSNAERRLTFRARHRLSGIRAFTRVHREGVRKPRGPIIVIGMPNDLPHCRLGLSVSRRVGNAVTRHAIKRKLRESFRLLQHDLPGGYDFVIIVRPHATIPMQRYKDQLASAWEAIDATYKKRYRRSSDAEPSA